MLKTICLIILSLVLSHSQAQDLVTANELLDQHVYDLYVVNYDDALLNYQMALEEDPTNEILPAKISQCEEMIDAFSDLTKGAYTDANNGFSAYKAINKDAAYYFGLTYLINEQTQASIDTAITYMEKSTELGNSDAKFMKVVLKAYQLELEKGDHVVTSIDTLNSELSLLKNKLAKKEENLRALYDTISVYQTKVEQVNKDNERLQHLLTNVRGTIVTSDSMEFIYDPHLKSMQIQALLIELTNYKGTVTLRTESNKNFLIEITQDDFTHSKKFNLSDSAENPLEVNILYDPDKVAKPLIGSFIKVYNNDQLIKTIWVVVKLQKLNRLEVLKQPKLGLSTSLFAGSSSDTYGNVTEAGNGFNRRYKLSLYSIVGPYVSFQHYGALALPNITDGMPVNEPTDEDFTKSKYVSVNYFEIGLNIKPFKYIAFIGGTSFKSFSAVGDYRLKVDNNNIFGTHDLSAPKKIKLDRQYCVGLGLVFPVVHFEGIYYLGEKYVAVNVGLNLTLISTKFQQAKKHYQSLVYTPQFIDPYSNQQL